MRRRGSATGEHENATDRTIDEAEEMIEQRTDIPMATLRERVDRVVEAAHDAGAIDAGVVDREPTPTVARALVAGKPVYRADGGPR